MEVQAILDLMKEMKNSGIESLEWQAEGQTLRLSRPCSPVAASSAADCEDAREHAAPASTASAEAVGFGAADRKEASAIEGRVVSSPVVGIFFAAASPDQEPFAVLGTCVETGAPLGIIEAMKLMNEVASPCSGIVIDVLVENGQRVEYGQPLFVIKENA